MITKRDKEIFLFIEKYKGITINQASKIFFSKKNGYDCARLRLKKLYNNGILDRYTNFGTKEIVYTFKGYKKLSPHSIHILNFYAEMVYHGVIINSFIQEKQWCIGKYRSDAFFEYTYNSEDYILCLEVDFTHMTNIKNKYVPLYESDEIQEEYGEGVFPKIVIMTYKKVDDNKADYPFPVNFINFNLDNFVEKVLL